MNKEIAQLKDAINHCEKVVCQQELNGCKECAEDHLQLAIWLRELIGYKTQNSDLESVRQELLERGDETVTFRDLVERFDEVEEEYKGQPWNLKQIYNNFNILIGKKPNNADDCISREAVLEQTYKWSKDEFLRVTNPFNYLRKKINSLPSVTPEQEPCIMYESKMRACKVCKHYGKLSLDCSRCDDDCSMFEENTHYDEFGFIDPFSFRKDIENDD